MAPRPSIQDQEFVELDPWKSFLRIKCSALVERLLMRLMRSPSIVGEASSLAAGNWETRRNRVVLHQNLEFLDFGPSGEAFEKRGK